MGRGLISEDVINQVKDRIDIAEVVGQHVSLSRAGQNLKGLCPFHQEKSPSFTVSPSRQIFHCFGCGAGGNVFTFLMRITGASFPDTVRELGQKFGVDVPDGGSNAGPQAAQAIRFEQLNRAVAKPLTKCCADFTGLKWQHARRAGSEECVQCFAFGTAEQGARAIHVRHQFQSAPRTHRLNIRATGTCQGRPDSTRFTEK